MHNSPLGALSSAAHVSEINFNSTLREQISFQPFISSPSYTAHLSLLIMCHSLMIDPSFLFPLSSYLFFQYDPFYISIYSLSFHCSLLIAHMGLFAVSLFILSKCFPLTSLRYQSYWPNPRSTHTSLNEVNFQSMKSYWPCAEVAHIVNLYWTEHFCMPVCPSLWSAVCLSYSHLPGFPAKSCCGERSLFT